jgi:hypothetical protein
MDADERGSCASARYRIISALLQADGPLTLPDLEAACRSETDQPDKATLLAVLKELVDSAQVVQGVLLPGRAAPQYAWRARWEQDTRAQTSSVQQDLRSALDAAEHIPPAQLDIASQPSTTFYRYVVGPEYHPPDNKRYLVFLQCSVRRPFSTAPSHAPMRRAIRIATGYDPRKDFAACPVHVVVLASKIGPVPYELEDLYPANVRGGGVKHFDRETYERVKPLLAERMAQYILTYSEQYERITSFTQGRYAEVLYHARKLAIQQGGPTFNILPQDSGAIVTRMNKSKPHQYWARYWIQLYLEIVDWLDPEQQRQARARLHKLEVEYRA